MPATASLPSAKPAVPKNVRRVLLGVMLAMLLSMLDNMVVSTAMPTIVGELGGLERISWVVTAYTLVTAVTTPVWGKLGDLVGRKSTFWRRSPCSSSAPPCAGRPSPWAS
jgi:MFS family permease